MKIKCGKRLTNVIKIFGQEELLWLLSLGLTILLKMYCISENQE